MTEALLSDTGGCCREPLNHGRHLLAGLLPEIG